MKKPLMTMLLFLTTVLVSVPIFSKTLMTQKPDQTSIDYTRIQAEKTGFVSVTGGKIWYRVNGLRFKDKKPAILVIHGGPGNSHDYLLPALQLADERMVIFYDQLDSGRSDRTNNTELWTLARFTDEVDAIRAALSLKEVHILGSSWGGSVAVNYAARKPAGLKSLILSGSLINTQRWVDDNERYRQQLPKKTLATMLKYEAVKDYAHPNYQKAVDFYYHRLICSC